MTEPNTTPDTSMRKFETGALRNLDQDKLDFEAFYTPRVVEAFATYMHFNRHLPDGTMRNGDNWQKGIPSNSYMKSGWRHFFDWWSWHRGNVNIKEGIVWALCGLIFNAQGYLDNLLKENPGILEKSVEQNEALRQERWNKAKGHYNETI